MDNSIRKFDYIFLDLDGPILDGKQRHYNCYADIVKLCGGTPLDIEEYWSLKRAKVDRKVILKKSNFMGAYNDFLSLWISRIEEHEYLKFDNLKPDIPFALKKLKKHCDKLVLVTMRNKPASVHSQLKAFNIISLFNEIIVCGSQSIEPKFTALKCISFKSALIIGDTEEDTVTAKNLGIKCIAILSGLREKKWLDADCYVNELANIETETLRTLLMQSE